MRHLSWCTQITVAAVLAGALGTGCSAAAGPAAGQLEKPDLVVAAVPALDSAGVYIAQQRGLFTAQGLHVKIVPAISSSDVIKAQLAGQYDISSGAYPSYIAANAMEHANLRVLAAGSDMAPTCQEIMVTAGSKINKVRDLEGKTIGVNALNNIGTLLIDSLLTDNAVPPSDVTFKVIPFPLMAHALTTHQVDAAWLPEPFITEAEESIGAQPLADANQGAAESLPIAGYVVTQTWLNKYPKTAAAFRRAIEQAQAIANTNAGAVQSAMAAYGGVSKMIAATATAPSFPLDDNAALLQRVASLMLQFNMLPQAYNVNQMIVSPGAS